MKMPGIGNECEVKVMFERPEYRRNDGWMAEERRMDGGGTTDGWRKNDG